MPLHPLYGVLDWDDAHGAILWPKMIAEVAHLQANGRPSKLQTNDHLIEQNQLCLEDKILDGWRKQFEPISEEAYSRGIDIVWAILDGFLMYWNPVRSSNSPAH